MTISLGDVARLYDATRDSAVEWHQAKNDLTAKLHRALAGLASSSRGLGPDEYWDAVISLLKISRAVVAGVPLPHNHPALALNDLYSRLDNLLASAEHHSPDRAPLALKAADALRDLLTSEENPLGDLVQGLVKGTTDAAIVLSQRRGRPPVMDALRTLFPRVHILIPADLRQVLVHDQLIVIGPSYYSPELLAAPRAPRIDVVHYVWQRDRTQSFALFPTRPDARGALVGPPPADAPEREGELDEEDLQPTIAWHSLRESVATAPSGEETETPAVLVLLAGGYAAYIDADDGTGVWSLDLDAEEDRRIRQERTQDVQEGMYILLRTGGGDENEIVQLADKILGSRALSLRAMQAKWKEQLHSLVREKGRRAVVEELTRRRVQNPWSKLGSWLWYGRIRAGRRDDWAALLKMLGRNEGEPEELWIALGHVHSAHVQAGQQIRKLLIAEARQADLAELRRNGRLDFQVRGLSGTLTAFRVESRSPEMDVVSVHHINRIFYVGEQWLG